jgi:hypothetical protein
MTHLTKIARSPGDPRVLRSGRSSRVASDELARGLGWFGIGLGVAQILAPRAFTRTLGLHGQDGLVRGFGVREIASGMLCLSVDRRSGLWARVAGDAMDLAALGTALHPGNRRRGEAALAFLAVLGVTALDVLGALGSTVQHRRTGGDRSLYRDRSGFPQGLAAARGAAGGVALGAARPGIAAGG